MKQITTVALLCLAACNNGLTDKQRSETTQIAKEEAKRAIDAELANNARATVAAVNALDAPKGTMADVEAIDRSMNGALP
jgi:hypothetical protein